MSICYNQLLKQYEQFLASFKILDDIYTDLSKQKFSQYYYDKKYAHCFTNFNPNDNTQKQLILKMRRLCDEYRSLSNDIKLKLAKENYKFANRYNSCVAKFRKELSYKSCLSGITYIPIVYANHIEIIDILYDCLTGDEIYYDEKKLILDDGAFVKYESEEYFLNCVKHHIDECTFKNIYFKTIYGKYMHISKFDMYKNKYEQLLLKLEFTDFKTKVKHQIYTDNIQFSQLSEVSEHKIIIDKIKKKISQIIGSEWNNKLCKFAIVNCLRCKQEHFIVKREKYTCTVCDLELCGKGCGRIFHGKLSCDSESKKMTAYLMKIYINSQCPSCKQYLEKDGGCNHMICNCKTQYCNQCGNEFQKDIYGRYMITEHYSAESDIFDDVNIFDEEDIRRRHALVLEKNICVQFPHVRNFTSIAMPNITSVARIL